MDAEETADAHQIDDERRTAVADERERHPDNRERAHDHQHIGHRLSADQKRQAQGKHLTVTVFRLLGDAESVMREQDRELYHQKLFANHATHLVTKFFPVHR